MQGLFGVPKIGRYPGQEIFTIGHTDSMRLGGADVTGCGGPTVCAQPVASEARSVPADNYPGRAFLRPLDVRHDFRVCGAHVPDLPAVILDVGLQGFLGPLARTHPGRDLYRFSPWEQHVRRVGAHRFRRRPFTRLAVAGRDSRPPCKDAPCHTGNEGREDQPCSPPTLGSCCLCSVVPDSCSSSCHGKKCLPVGCPYACWELPLQGATVSSGHALRELQPGPAQWLVPRIRQIMKARYGKQCPRPARGLQRQKREP